MPDVVVHTAFALEVRGGLPGEIAEKIRELPYRIAAFGPDAWFGHQPWKRREGRGRRMHTTRTGEFLMALANRAKESRHPDEVFSYLAGFLCHYALDQQAHPYIIYMTEIRTKYPRGHMSFEHCLDRTELKRAGLWGGKHPVTEHYFPKGKIPEEIREDLDAVFEKVYGWKNSWKALRKSYPLYRLFYRVTENPKGLFTRVAGWTGHPVLKALTYATSHFDGTDVENNQRQDWTHSHDASLRSADSFRDMKDAARRNAAEMIEAAYRYIFLSEISEEELAARIGSRSYLSGLEEDDPRNRAVPFLLPPEKEERRTP